MASNLYIEDFDNGKLLKYANNTFSSTIIASVSVANDGGIVWDGTNIYWSVGTSTPSVKKGTGFTSVVQSSFNAPAIGTRMYDADFDGTNMLILGINSNKAYRMTGFTSTVGASFATTAGNDEGLGWDGTNALTNEGIAASTKAKQRTGFTATVISSFLVVVSSNGGITWDGTNAITSTTGGKIRQFSGFTNTVNASFTVSTADVFGVMWGTDAATPANGNFLAFM